MGSKREKLTPVPNPRRRSPEGRARRQADGNGSQPVSAVINLDHIAESLRPLAFPADQLQFHPKNPRRHSEAHIAEIAASLRVNGQQKNLVASTRTEPATVVCGNGTLRAALSLGWSHVAVSRLALTEAQENQLALVDNVVGAKPDWDAVNVAEMLRDVRTDGNPEIEALLAGLAKEVGIGESAPALEDSTEQLVDDNDNPEAEFLAPFPWFGGKGRVATFVWKALGDIQSYVEPFFGSGAVLLRRPLPQGRLQPDGIETVNDFDGLVCNFWRAAQADPDTVAKFADWPVLENDLHGRHLWLVERKDSLQARLEGDPDFFDAKVAGWWVWGMACWIGSGFCSGEGPWQVQEIDGVRQLVHLGDAGQGVNRKLVHLGDAGRGVNRQLVHLGNAGRGVNRQLVHLGDAGRGVNRQLVHLGDAGQGKAGTGEQGLLAWMRVLSERLRRVRVCCGDWTRICGGNSGDALNHMVQQTPCGVFLDPPYADTAGRDEKLYRKEDTQVAHAVREWAIAHGDDERLRIVLCGYEGEHQMPVSWRKVAWKAQGGMGNQGNGAGKENCHRERLWLSPHCLRS